MGGGNQQTHQVQDTSTKVETTTNATIGDVGLTGKDAVEFAKALGDGAVKLVQTVGSSYQPLVAGAGNVLAAQGEQKSDASKTVFKALEDNAVLIAVVAGAITIFFAARK